MNYYEDEIEVEEENLEDEIEVEEEMVVVNTGGTTDHSKLKHLDYENSGHTGFASSDDLQTETTSRQTADTNLQEQIDAITVSSDVVDIVGTYQELQNYDTTKLTDDDIIKVMQDSTHSNAMSYYRWSSNAWVYVGSEGPFYTKSESDTKFQDKLVSGTNIKTINNNSILGSGNLDIEGGYPEVPEKLYEYTNLLDLLNEPMYIPDGIYTVSQKWYCDIPKENDEWTSDYINPNSILYIYRNYGFISWSGPTSSMYWSNGDETFTGGVLTTIDDVNYAIDDKLGSDVVMANTEQTISGKKKFTSPNGTVFENAGGLIIKYLSSSPEFKIIPDNNGNFDIYYQNTQLGRIDSNYTTLYRGFRPYLTEQVDLGSNTYKFNNIYAKTLYGNNVPKEVSKLITNDNDILPEMGGILSLGNSTYRWNSLYLGTNINFNPQQVTRIENLKTLSVNLIKLGQQQGSTTTWMDSNFLQLDSDDIKCVGKLLGGLNVNNMVIHNISDTPDDGTSPINKNYADTNLQDKLTAGTGIAITNNVISSTLEGIDYEVDQELPATGEKGIIYLIPNGSSETENIYDEYIWIPPLQEGDTGRFEFIGTTQTDLSNYVDLSSTQTISGLKTFSGDIKVSSIRSTSGTTVLNMNASTAITYGAVRPSTNNSGTIGTSNRAYTGVYTYNISDGTNSVAVADIADKDYVDTKIGDVDTVLTRLVSGGGVQ